MDKLLVTVIPCSLVVLSLFRMLKLMKNPRPRGEFFTLCLSAGVAALSMRWASLAIGHGFASGPLSVEFHDASWVIGPVLGALFVAALYAGPLAASVGLAVSRLCQVFFGRKR